MRIAIAGASGFIGQHLTTYFTRKGCQVVSLSRRLLCQQAFDYLVEILESCDVLINLTGASINHYWTSGYKADLRKSRVEVTSQLVCALKLAKKKPSVMLSASAVGYYPSTGCYDESHEVNAPGFLASLCREWEAAARQCPAEVRLVIMRFGVVLSCDGGAMRQMLTPLLHTKCTTILGSGQQAFPWIALTDVCRAISYLIEHEEAAGVYNLVSPQQITQQHLARILGKAYGSWWALPIPAFFLRLVYGEMSSVLLSGQSVSPSRLLGGGFEFAVPTVEEGLGLLEWENYTLQTHSTRLPSGSSVTLSK